MAVNQRAAAKAVVQAEGTLKRVQESHDNTNGAGAKRDPGRPPKAAARLEQVAQDGATTRHEHQRLAGQREPVTQSIRASGHASPFVDVERGVRRNGKRIAGDMQQPIATIRTIAPQEHLSQACLDRREQAERGVPTMQATLEFVSGYGRQPGRQRALAPPASYAMHAPLIPSYSLERVAATRTMTEGAPLRARAERLRTPLFEPGGTLGALNTTEQNQLKAKATKLAEVFQRSSSPVEGRHGYLSLRHHQLRGLDHPRKRACLTAVPNFFLTRADGTTAAERCFGQKPRAMCAAILASVALPPAPLSPPRRAVG